MYGEVSSYYGVDGRVSFSLSVIDSCMTSTVVSKNPFLSPFIFDVGATLATIGTALFIQSNSLCPSFTYYLTDINGNFPSSIFSMSSDVVSITTSNSADKGVYDLKLEGKVLRTIGGGEYLSDYFTF